MDHFVATPARAGRGHVQGTTEQLLEQISPAGRSDDDVEVNSATGADDQRRPEDLALVVPHDNRAWIEVRVAQHVPDVVEHSVGAAQDWHLVGMPHVQHRFGVIRTSRRDRSRATRFSAAPAVRAHRQRLSLAAGGNGP
ncbi:MAG: hypothetical protein M3353_04070, partial [Actinomycetota bacterium]|nr:hypothetical protein [Actinomycetota bacterium]